MLNSAQSRLLEALEDAVSTIREAVAEGNADLAMKLVQGFGALRRPEPGPSDAAQVARRVAAEELREEADTQQIESAATAPGDRGVIGNFEEHSR